ncbi:hypothetical protein ABK040_003937 [Willaertia magna]
MRVTTDTVLCNLCLEDVDTEEPLQATHYCNNCNKNLCDGHVQLHKAKKSTKDHNLNPLLTSNQQQSPTATTAAPTTSVTSTAPSSIVINQQHYCKHHSDQLLEIYCEECDDVFCFKCALFNHKLHKLCDVKEIAKEKLLKVNELLKDLNSKKEILLQRNDQLKLTITKVKEQIDLNKNEIKQHCNDLHKCIDNKMEQLLLEVDKIGNEKLQSLQNEMQLVKDCQNNLNSICELKNDNAIDILQNKLKLEKEVKELNNLNVLNNLNEMN